MLTSIDRAGRVVVPKSIRDALGLVTGTEIDIDEYGGVIQLRPRSSAVRLEQRGDRLVIVGGGALITDAIVNELRDADRR